MPESLWPTLMAKYSGQTFLWKMILNLHLHTTILLHANMTPKFTNPDWVGKILDPSSKCVTVQKGEIDQLWSPTVELLFWFLLKIKTFTASHCNAALVPTLITEVAALQSSRQLFISLTEVASQYKQHSSSVTWLCRVWFFFTFHCAIFWGYKPLNQVTKTNRTIFHAAGCLQVFCSSHTQDCIFQATERVL